jgi:hypothetical protein
MKYSKTLFFTTSTLLVLSFFSCKKETLVADSSNLKVYSFSTSQCVITSDNNFLLTGPTSISKIDANGTVLWTIDNNTDYILPLQNNEFATCRDNGLSVTLSRLSTEGSVLFSKKLFMSDSSELSNPKIVEFSSGHLMCMGTKVTGADSSLLLIKTDATGNAIWNKKVKLNTNLSVVNKAIEITADGNFIVTGNTGKVNFSTKIYYAMIDSSGTLIWEKYKAFGKWENYPTNIQKISSTEYIITGYYDISTTVDYNYQFYAYKINSTGDYVNLFNAGASKQDYCISSTYVQSNDNLIMVGMEGRGRDFNDLNLSSIKILTINSSLSSVVSDKTYAQLQQCAGLCAIYNSDGSLSLIGKKYAYDNQNIQQTFFLKIKPDGSF